MHHVMICVEKPKSTQDLAEWNKWLPFFDALQKQPELTKGTRNPVENVWLVPLDNSLTQITGFRSLLREYGLKHQFFLMSDEPRTWG
jgi:hypothetical protein